MGLRFPFIFFKCVQYSVPKMQKNIVFLVIALVVTLAVMQRYKIQLKAEHIAIGAVLTAAALQNSHTMENIWKKGGIKKLTNTLDRKAQNYIDFVVLPPTSDEDLVKMANIAVEEVSAVGKATGVGVTSAFKTITDLGKPKTLDDVAGTVAAGGLLGAAWDGFGSFFGF